MKAKWAVLLIAAAILSSAAARAQVLIIANSSVTADSASKSELRSVFTGESSRLKDGSHVKPVLLKEGPAHTAFVSGDLSMSEAGLLICWRQQVFSGQSTMPRSFASEAEEVAYIAQTPGAIGYIGTSTPHDGVKVIEVK
jgi:ABC-type phosphate transport system substrate-binding protein